MFMHKSKKGFTIVELVIVIAVIAILAAVLIPTFSNLVKKANIANDTALAKNINTALTAYKATNAGDMEFEDVIAAARDAGYIISNLNPTTAGHYFVWEKSTNQILLVDGENAYKVIYANNENYASIGASWYFATSDKTAAAALKADTAISGAQVKDMVGSAAALSEALAAGGEVYLDESVVVTPENIVKIDSAENTILNLGSSTLNTNGVIDIVPVVVQSDATIKGGVIGAAGAGVSADGKEVSIPLYTADGTNLSMEDTKFNITTTNGYINMAGNATLDNVSIDTCYMGIGAYGHAQITLKNSTINSTGRCFFVSNYLKQYDENGMTVLNNGSPVVLVSHAAGTAKLTIESGTYHGDYTPDVGGALYPPVVAFSGDIVITGGNFSSGAKNDKPVFQVMDANGSITITGGTFNGVEFSKVTNWNSLIKDSNVSVSADGKTVTISK